MTSVHFNDFSALLTGFISEAYQSKVMHKTFAGKDPTHTEPGVKVHYRPCTRREEFFPIGETGNFLSTQQAQDSFLLQLPHHKAQEKGRGECRSFCGGSTAHGGSLRRENPPLALGQLCAMRAVQPPLTSQAYWP